MEQNIHNIMKEEKIEKYKIVKIDCKKKSYSFVYSEEERKTEEVTTYLIRFLWDGEIKEIKMVSKNLCISKALLRYLKKMPGIVNITEDFDLIPPSFTYYEEKTKEFNVRVQELLSKLRDTNIVIEQEEYHCKWYSENKEFEQNFVKYRVLYFHLITNNFIDYSFYNENGWKDLYSLLFERKKEELEIRKKDKHQMYELTAVVMSKILTKITELFYANRIYNNGSFFVFSDIGKKMFTHYINLYSVPGDNLFFDAEGNQIRKKSLIKEGVIKGILSNSYYSMKMQNTYSGNASLINKEEIESYRIKFDTVIKNRCTDSFPKMLDFETLDVTKDKVKGIAICDDGKIYKLEVDISIYDFMNNVVYINKEFTWVEKCWTTNAILEI